MGVKEITIHIIAYNISIVTNIAAKHWQTATHRLTNDIGESFVDARQYHSISIVVHCLYIISLFVELKMTLKI